MLGLFLLKYILKAKALQWINAVKTLIFSNELLLIYFPND